MELKNYFAQDSAGNVIPNAVCTLYLAGTATLATDLKTDTGSNLTNPFRAGKDGLIAVAAPNGLYDMEVRAGERSYTIRTQFIDMMSAIENAAATAAKSTRGAIADAIAASGYEVVGDYSSGMLLTRYSQVIRDSSGEFWRVSGRTDLPYTTTGNGLPENDAFVLIGDAVIRQQLTGPAGYRLVAGQMAASAYGVPAPLQNARVESETYRIADYVDGVLYSTRAGHLFSSTDFGETYTLTISGKSPVGVLKAIDGEMLFLFSNRVEKSTGWLSGPASATWSVVLSLPTQSEPTYFLRWGVDGDGTKFIATHYGNSGAVYRVWISTDAGSTFDMKFDQSDYTDDRSHFHAACYDSWADRFYFCYGHGEPAGIYYSDDDGENWGKMRQYSREHEGVLATFTTMVATDFGVVCGTDRYPNGVYILRRSENPDDVQLELAKRWDSVRGNLIGFADRAFRDADTGIVYTSFRADWQEVAPVIIACGSGGAEIVYTADLHPTNPRRIQNVLAAKGKLLAYVNNPDQNIKADLAPYTRTNNSWVRGNIVVPEDAPFGSTIAGHNTRTDAGRVSIFGANCSAMSKPEAALFDGTAVGYGAKIIGSESVGIGSDTRVTNRSVAIGHGVKTGDTAESTTSNIVAVGYGALATENNATALGASAEATAGNLAVGYGAKATQSSATALGRGAQSSGLNSTVVGQGAQGGDFFAPTAIGQAAKATSSYTVAVGHNAEATAANATTIGARSSVGATGGVAVGERAMVSASGGIALGSQANCGNGIAVGTGALSSGVEGVAVGNAAQASGPYGTALGREAKATHTESVAIGRKTESYRANSVCVGSRDIESMKPGGGLFLRSPNGTVYKLSISDAGAIAVSTA